MLSSNLGNSVNQVSTKNVLSRLNTLLIPSDILVYTDSIMRTVHKKYAVFYCASFGTTLIATMLSISKISRKVNNVISRDLFF